MQSHQQLPICLSVSFPPSRSTFPPSLPPVDRDGHGREGDGRPRLAFQARGLRCGRREELRRPHDRQIHVSGTGMEKKEYYIRDTVDIGLRAAVTHEQVE